MHILHIPVSLPRWNSPTSGIYVKRLAEAQRKCGKFDRVGLMGIQIQSIFKTAYQLVKRRMPSLLKPADFDWELLKNVHTLKRYNRRYRDGALKYAYEISKLFKKYESRWGTPDLIHANSGRGAGLASAFIKITHGIPFVVQEHHPDFIEGDFSDGVDQLRFVYNEAEQILTVSEGMNTGVEQVGEYPTTVLPNVVAKTFFEGPISGNSPEPPYFLSVGRLDGNRNQKLALDALNMCRNEYNIDCALRIAGTGKKEEELRSHVSRLDLNNSVFFLGHVPQSELKRQYANAAATLICSHRETFSLPVVESLACGTPVIATPTTGPQSINNTIGYGIYLKKPDADDFAKQMKKCLSNPRFDQNRIRQAALDNYSPGSISNYSFEIYKKCMENNRI